MSQAELFDSRGRRISLGSQIGRRGGEGSAFEAASHPGFVVKLYHDSVPADKTEKLSYLCSLGETNARLSQIAAWPSSVVRGSKGVRGFLMPLVRGKEVHQLFGPRERHIEFPNAGWDFLINAARNCAAAFDTVHATGAVIGDVNEGNLLVASDGTVKLIDCDSFQVSKGQQHWGCDVGVPLWTSPELQALNFRGLRRTVNHDLFGLAVLIFRLLFMGRHPYAGIPTHTTSDFVLEKAIANYQFAFASNAEALGVKRPPHSLAMSAVAPDCSVLFGQAFLRGSEKKRPSAAEWVTALETLQRSVVPCQREPSSHKFFRGLSSCPWCAIAASGGPTFFLSLTVVAHVTTDNPQILWNRISQFEELPLKPIRRGDFSGLTMVGAPVANVPKNVRTSFVVGLTFCIVSVFALFAGSYLFTAAWVLFGFGLMYRGSTERSFEPEKVIRAKAQSSTNDALEKSLSERESLRSKYNSMVADELKKLRAIHDRISHLANERAEDMRKAEARKRDLQLRDFLDKQHIFNAGIHGIGPARLSTLSAYGIETALDITPHINVPGIGEKYTARLLNWRRLCEARFRFNPSIPLPPQEVQQIDGKFAKIRNQLIFDLKQGPQTLATLNSQARSKFNQLDLQINSQSKSHAQACADFESLSKHIEANAPPGNDTETTAFVAGAISLALAFLTSGTSRPSHQELPASPTPAPASPSLNAIGPVATPATPRTIAVKTPAFIPASTPQSATPFPRSQITTPNPTIATTPSVSRSAETLKPRTPRPVPMGEISREARIRAIARYPSLGVADSPLNRAFLAQVKRYQLERPEIFDAPEWPSIIAEECMTGNSSWR